MDGTLNAVRHFLYDLMYTNFDGCLVRIPNGGITSYMRELEVMLNDVRSVWAFSSKLTSIARFQVSSSTVTCMISLKDA